MSAIVEPLRYDDNKWALRLVGRDRCRCHARWAAGVSHGERTGVRHMGHGGHHGMTSRRALGDRGLALVAANKGMYSTVAVYHLGFRGVP